MNPLKKRFEWRLVAFALWPGFRGCTHLCFTDCRTMMFPGFKVKK
ncbi:hypothetical protein A11S_917 [Micavibrio aeruginosavorus EPB]|uniref:Uncharacterized protein n=1 Tax=Micavibrio aeruginosavorus EPB TaxID=349215 RepID=M4VES6_9BACT|nr:hypothetical protein A11S_917 [Micavibrio aeruginosavorus EPB]